MQFDGRASWPLAALGIAFSLLGCGESANNSLWDRIVSSPSASMPARAPEIVPTAQAMAGRWTLTMPGTGACGMTFVSRRRRSIALDSNCPGKFSASRSWSIEPTPVHPRSARRGAGAVADDRAGPARRADAGVRRCCSAGDRARHPSTLQRGSRPKADTDSVTMRFLRTSKSQNGTRRPSRSRSSPGGADSLAQHRAGGLARIDTRRAEHQRRHDEAGRHLDLDVAGVLLAGRQREQHGRRAQRHDHAPHRPSPTTSRR